MSARPLFALALCLAAPASARAWSDPSRFAEPVLDGGGADRWFTGSPADGFSCNVCHSGQEGVEVTVRSVPETYTPGQTYEIVVAWGNPQAKVAANVEITDELGRPIGSLSAAPAAALQPADECEPKGQGIGASQVFMLPNGRQVLGLADCGASQVRWQWTAPAFAAGPAFLAGALVLSNDDDSLAGDGVTVLARSILAPGMEPIDTRASASCGVVRAGSASTAAVAWVVAVISILFSMRRLSRRPGRSA